MYVSHTHTSTEVRGLAEIAWPSRGNTIVLPGPTLPCHKQKVLWPSGYGVGLLSRWGLPAWARTPQVAFSRALVCRCILNDAAPHTPPSQLRGFELLFYWDIIRVVDVTLGLRGKSP